MRSIRPLLLACSVLLAGPVAAATLVNGSFEAPGCAGNCLLGAGDSTITGWTTVFTGVEYFNAPALGGTAPHGVMVIDLANFTHSAGGLEQTFATNIGESYALSFWAGNALRSGRTGTGDVRVQVAGFDQTFATPVATTAAFVWQQIDLQFTATAAASTLRFSNTQDANLYFALIDNVAVAAVPEPATWAFMLGGLLTMAIRVRRRI